MTIDRNDPAVNLVTTYPTAEKIVAIRRAVIDLEATLAPSYGVDALAIAAGYVAGWHQLDAVEYVPKLIDLVGKAS